MSLISAGSISLDSTFNSTSLHEPRTNSRRTTRRHYKISCRMYCTAQSTMNPTESSWMPSLSASSTQGDILSNHPVYTTLPDVLCSIVFFTIYIDPCCLLEWPCCIQVPWRVSWWLQLSWLSSPLLAWEKWWRPSCLKSQGQGVGLYSDPTPIYFICL